MPTIIDENILRFVFGDNWQVRKFDDSSFYRKHFEKLDGSKAVDFLGLHGRELFFIEIKDFRGYRIDNKKRLSSHELYLEVGQKVRDSVACLVAAYRQQPEEWQPFIDSLRNTQRPIKVVLWLEEDINIHLTPQKQKANNIAALNALEKKLRWLTPRVSVANQQINQLPDLVVENLPHP